MTTKYIVIAAGEQTRWNNYLNVEKHYVILNGEPIIERTVRQLNEHKINPKDIIVASKHYKLDNATNIYPKLDYENNADADKFLSTSHHWNTQGRTVIIYGDVYFTDQAIKTIIQYQGKDWRNFCRPYPSQITGGQWGECFAISFYPNMIEQGLKQLHRIAQLHKTNKISRCGGWEWTRAIYGVPDKNIRHPHLKHCPLYYIIDDLTEDIDYPDDYERLKQAIEKQHG